MFNFQMNNMAVAVSRGYRLISISEDSFWLKVLTFCAFPRVCSSDLKYQQYSTRLPPLTVGRGKPTTLTPRLMFVRLGVGMKSIGFLTIVFHDFL